MKTGHLEAMGPATRRVLVRRTVQVATATKLAGADSDNFWVIEDSPEEDDEDLDQTTAFDITGGEWEPAGVKVRRKLASLYRRLF